MSTIQIVTLIGLFITLLAVAYFAVWPWLLHTHLAKFWWYADYFNLYTEVRAIKTHRQLDTALEHYCQFTSCKKTAATYEHKQCSKIIVRHLLKKYKQLNAKPKQAPYAAEHYYKQHIQVQVNTQQILQLN